MCRSPCCTVYIRYDSIHTHIECRQCSDEQNPEAVVIRPPYIKYNRDILSVFTLQNSTNLNHHHFNIRCNFDKVPQRLVTVTVLYFTFLTNLTVINISFHSILVFCLFQSYKSLIKIRMYYFTFYFRVSKYMYFNSDIIIFTMYRNAIRSSR